MVGLSTTSVLEFLSLSLQTAYAVWQMLNFSALGQVAQRVVGLATEEH